MASFATHENDDAISDDESEDDEINLEETDDEDDEDPYAAVARQHQHQQLQVAAAALQQSQTTDDDDDDDDDESDDNDNNVVNMAEQYAATVAATARTTLKPAIVPTGKQAPPGAAQTTDEDDDAESVDSGDGDIPLATPYPWAQDDYEFTLHHEPKRRKIMGTGMMYLKRLTQENSNDDSKYEEATVLSSPAKQLLKQLMQQTKKDGHNGAEEEEEEEDSSDEEESDSEDDDDEDDEDVQKQRRHLPGPRLYTTSLEPYSSATSSIPPVPGLFHTICTIMDEAHPLNVTNRHIVRACALMIPHGAPPATMDAKEMICCALYFLSLEWKSPDPTALPDLPLIRNNTAPGNARDLEKHAYEKVGDWNPNTLLTQLRELERLFFHSPATLSPTAYVPTPIPCQNLQWQSRLRFCPRRRNDTKGKEQEATILLKGTVPTRMLGKQKPIGRPKGTSSPKNKAGGGGGGGGGGDASIGRPKKKATTATGATKTTGTKKKKGSPSTAAAAAASIVVKTEESNDSDDDGMKPQGIVIRDGTQGKQLPSFLNNPDMMDEEDDENDKVDFDDDDDGDDSGEDSGDEKVKVEDYY